ncbi:MAG TPA: preprotein translocase subunit YajC [Nannocystaceae bacterium]|nr:preprotein translocase subunit YajC [Nannocystaceae bacterium]
MQTSPILALGVIADAAAPSFLSGPLPMLVLMFLVMYLLVLRPASKQEKARRERIAAMQKGDDVRLSGGILGKVTGVEGDVAIVEIADRVKIRVMKAEIAEVTKEPAAAATTTTSSST